MNLESFGRKSAAGMSITTLLVMSTHTITNRQAPWVALGWWGTEA